MYVLSDDVKYGTGLTAIYMHELKSDFLTSNINKIATWWWLFDLPRIEVYVVHGRKSYWTVVVIVKWMPIALMHTEIADTIDPKINFVMITTWTRLSSWRHHNMCSAHKHTHTLKVDYKFCIIFSIYCCSLFDFYTTIFMLLFLS